MSQTCATEDDAARDVDVVAGGNEIAEDVEEFGHGLTREDVAGKEDAGKKGEEGELYRFGLRISFAGNEDADGKRDEKIWQGEEPEQQYVAVDGNVKDKAHEGDDGAQLRESDDQVWEKLAEEQAEWAHGSDEKLLERAAL